MFKSDANETLNDGICDSCGEEAYLVDGVCEPCNDDLIDEGFESDSEWDERCSFSYGDAEDHRDHNWDDYHPDTPDLNDSLQGNFEAGEREY